MSIELSEISKLYDFPIATLRYWIHAFPEISKLFYKKEVIREENNSTRRRKMWFIDEENIDKLLIHIKNGRKKPRKRFDRVYSWSRSAIECYEAKLKCSVCPNNYICSAFTKKGQTPPMKNIIIEMIKQYGIPPERIIEE